MKSFLSKMSKLFALVLLFNSYFTFAGNLDSCGLDNNPVLNKWESDFLNVYLKDTVSQFSFENKKIAFISGSAGSILGSKTEYFNDVKTWGKNDSRIATWKIILTPKEKALSGGYDAIVTYWVKVLTKRRRKKIIQQLKK